VTKKKKSEPTFSCFGVNGEKENTFYEFRMSSRHLMVLPFNFFKYYNFKLRTVKLLVELPHPMLILLESLAVESPVPGEEVVLPSRLLLQQEQRG